LVKNAVYQDLSKRAVVIVHQHLSAYTPTGIIVFGKQLVLDDPRCVTTILFGKFGVRDLRSYLRGRVRT
jgi:hypothetical protein